MLSDAMLAIAAETSKWVDRNGNAQTPREMTKGHLGACLGYIYPLSKDEVYCGHTYSEWQQIFRYENNYRSFLSQLNWEEKQLNKLESKLYSIEKNINTLLSELAETKEAIKWQSSKIEGFREEAMTAHKRDC